MCPSVFRMECVYIESQYIRQVWVHGSSLKSVTVAVIVPDEPSVKFWADSRGLPRSVDISTCLYLSTISLSLAAPSPSSATTRS